VNRNVQIKFTYSVDGVELPVGGKVSESMRVDVLVDGKSNLDEEVHDHETTGSESEWDNLQSVGDNQTRPGNGVADIEEPDECNLRVSETLDLYLTAGFEAGCNNSPGQEE
jgi:hypothetical protein